MRLRLLRQQLEGRQEVDLSPEATVLSLEED